MLKSLILLAGIFVSIPSWSFEFPIVPNSDWTFGSLCTQNDPDFRGLYYKENIPRCFRSVSSSTKARIYDRYGVPPKCRSQYTIDHFVPLSMGGTNHEDNLWPEHKSVKETRMNLELDVYHMLQDGEVNQETAIQMVVEEKVNPSFKVPPSIGCWN
ncbi:MAG: HNH endonuclease [Bdellovibrionales bacterium]|nr:HNH endonuclease [Bdellovibrionales bacterium]